MEFATLATGSRSSWRLWLLSLLVLSMALVITANTHNNQNNNNNNNNNGRYNRLSSRIVSNSASSSRSNNSTFQGMNVCPRTMYVRRPMPTRQTYRRPVTRKDYGLCARFGEMPCNRTYTTYQTAHRIVMRMGIELRQVPGCCPGWRKRAQNDTDCLVSQCNYACQNGGTCLGPDTCSCTKGYAGRFCEQDIDECAGWNPCHQNCINLPGSHTCSCAEGFVLAKDQRSCDLCLSCTSEFQQIQQQMTSLPEVEDALKQREMATMNVQADMMAKMKQQEDTFGKLQSQYDTIVHIQKELDVLPKINQRLDNLTQLHAEVKELNALDKKVVDLEKRLNDGLTTMKASQTGLAKHLEAEVGKWQMNAVASSQSQASAIEALQDQLTKMAARLTTLEQEKVTLEANLTTVMGQYETAMGALEHRQASATSTTAPTSSSTTSTTAPPVAHNTTEDPYMSDGDLMPLDRLASLSQQISILEERMSECSCGQDYYG